VDGGLIPLKHRVSYVKCARWRGTIRPRPPDLKWKTRIISGVIRTGMLRRILDIDPMLRVLWKQGPIPATDRSLNGSDLIRRDEIPSLQSQINGPVSEYAKGYACSNLDRPIEDRRPPRLSLPWPDWGGGTPTATAAAAEEYCPGHNAPTSMHGNGYTYGKSRRLDWEKTYRPIKSRTGSTTWWGGQSWHTNSGERFRGTGSRFTLGKVPTTLPMTERTSLDNRWGLGCARLELPRTTEICGSLLSTLFVRRWFVGVKGGARTPESQLYDFGRSVRGAT
jgi:hypothetical protein